MVNRPHFRTVVISDIHMGSKHAKVAEAAKFLGSVDCDRLIMNGDIIDGWQLQKRSGVKGWRPEYTLLFKTVMKMMENWNTEVIYIRGNHDDFLENIAPLKLGSVSIVRDYVLESGDKRYFITHGDVFDSVTSNMKWLAKLGDISYNALLRINGIYNKYRLKQGKPYFSLSQFLKHKVKQAVSVISGFEGMLADLARSKKCDGVICGHIHYPENRMIGGIHYLNSGDWVESLSALVETFDGEWSIVRYPYPSISGEQAD